MIELRVSDLKQWFYCPRVVYWAYCLPIERPRTYKMEHGAQQHEVLAALERRRDLKAYDLKSGQRFFHVPLFSPRLGLRGVLDALLLTEEGRYLPVEFKETTGPVGSNHRHQLTGYALLVEDLYSAEVEIGFVYRIPVKRVTAVSITEVLKRRVRAALAEMRAMVEGEQMPAPARQRAKCADCEFRRYCADVW